MRNDYTSDSTEESAVNEVSRALDRLILSQQELRKSLEKLQESSTIDVVVDTETDYVN